MKELGLVLILAAAVCSNSSPIFKEMDTKTGWNFTLPSQANPAFPSHTVSLVKLWVYIITSHCNRKMLRICSYLSPSSHKPQSVLDGFPSQQWNRGDNVGWDLISMELCRALQWMAWGKTHISATSKFKTLYSLCSLINTAQSNCWFSKPERAAESEQYLVFHTLYNLNSKKPHSYKYIPSGIHLGVAHGF